MISAVAFCPQVPLVVPAAAAGAAAELDLLRAACRAAITRVAGPGRQLILLGAAETSAIQAPPARGSLAGFGVPLEVLLAATGADRADGADAAGGAGGAGDLPPSLTVAAWLVEDALGPGCVAAAVSVGPDFAADRAAAELRALADTDDLALVVAGDGTARRSTLAPGYLDERAVPFDDAVAAALRDGDAAALAGLDPTLGAELLAAGVPAWRVAGELLGGPAWDADVLYEDDPYGVAYLVAAWTLRA